MGLKRIMGQFEVTFPVDDPRTLDELADLVPAALTGGIQAEGGTLARVAIVSVAADPDPEPTIETIDPTPVDPTAPGGPLEWA